MGIKGVELGLWYYTYGVMAGNRDYLTYGDSLINQAKKELAAGRELLAQQ